MVCNKENAIPFQWIYQQSYQIVVYMLTIIVHLKCSLWIYEMKKYKKWIQGMKECCGKGIPISISKNVISFNGIMCTIKMFRKWIQVLVKFDATIWSDSVSIKGARIPLGSLWKPFCQPNSFEDEWKVFSAWSFQKNYFTYFW